MTQQITGDRAPLDRAPLWSRGMAAVLAAQFLSAMADNALLFAALALLKAKLYPQWTDPLLQEFFVGAYILLAPFAGPFADALPKGRVMLISNGLKLIGSLGICLGLNPFLAYGLVGVGAATYSPAKYGILSELTSADQLVKANGLMESSTIAAILIGAVAGGTLADLLAVAQTDLRRIEEAPCPFPSSSTSTPASTTRSACSMRSPRSQIS